MSIEPFNVFGQQFFSFLSFFFFVNDFGDTYESIIKGNSKVLIS